MEKYTMLIYVPPSPAFHLLSENPFLFDLCQFHGARRLLTITKGLQIKSSHVAYIYLHKSYVQRNTVCMSNGAGKSGYLCTWAHKLAQYPHILRCELDDMLHHLRIRYIRLYRIVGRIIDALKMRLNGIVRRDKYKTCLCHPTRSRAIVRFIARINSREFRVNRAQFCIFFKYFPLARSTFDCHMHIFIPVGISTVSIHIDYVLK